MTDACIQKYVDIVGNQNKGSASTVAWYLKDFELFCATELEVSDREHPVCEIIQKLKAGKWNKSPKEEQPYDVLSRYAAWLVTERLETGMNNARTVSYKKSWARTLLEVNFIPISKALFKALVKTPRPEDPDTSPVEKKTIVSILTAIPDMDLRSYVMFLASGGWRATESLSLSVGNLEKFDLKTLKFTGTPFINATGKHAKTKKGKRRQLTNEVARQIEKLLAWNYRKRRIHHKVDGKWVNRVVVPVPKITDPLFAPYHTEVSEYYKMGLNSKLSKEERLENLYGATSKKFRQTTDRLGVKWEGENEDGNRRMVTLHTLRRFVYTQCKRVVDEGYAKYHTGRKTHEYDKATEEEIAEDFAAVEPYLTFLDTTAMDEKQKTITKELHQQRGEIEALKHDRELYIETLREDNVALKDLVTNELGIPKEEMVKRLQKFADNTGKEVFGLKPKRKAHEDNV